jgi:hypothetical protein
MPANPLFQRVRLYDSPAEEIVGKSVRNPTKNTEEMKKRVKHFMEMLRRQLTVFLENLSIALKRN